MADEEGAAAVPDGVTRQEFSELQASVKDLADALRQQAEAGSAAEKDAAQQEVREAKADLREIARELGISPASLEKAAQEARRQERKEELRPILLELLDEELADEQPAADQKPKKEKKEPAAANGAEPETDAAEEEDKAPVVSHWSERPIGDLFR